MGGGTYTDSSYHETVREKVSDTSHVTREAEQRVRETGKLNPQVDPAEFGVIRVSKPRFNQIEGTNLWELAISIPILNETHLDTTGSMGDNVNKALKALPNQYKLCSQMLPGIEVQLLNGIFGDVVDDFVLNRPKPADSAERLVERLTLLHPEGEGGDGTEDPQYGLFGAAYLTDARINRYGLKYYDFTVSDADSRTELSSNQLTRIFGKEVFDKVAENGYTINKSDLPNIYEIVKDLLKNAHAFFIQIDDRTSTNSFWKKVYGPERVVCLHDIKYLPHLQALIIGLTEGTIKISKAKKFLTDNKVTEKDADILVESVKHIPIGAQAELRAKIERPLPKKGDIFKERTDTWPIENPEAIKEAAAAKEKSSESGTTDTKEWL